tara:strand:- start:62 stop:400 length:339 start_codon:yes stop_codon:yes gene_type:complete
MIIIMKGRYNCSVKNSSLRNLLSDSHLFDLWIDWNTQFDRHYRVVWNKFNSECFWIEFRKNITLEFLRICKLEELVLKINKQFTDWESSHKLGIFDKDCEDPPIPQGSVDFG